MTACIALCSINKLLNHSISDITFPLNNAVCPKLYYLKAFKHPKLADLLASSILDAFPFRKEQHQILGQIYGGFLIMQALSQ